MIKRLIYELNRDQDVIIKDSNDIHKSFKYIREDQYAPADQNGVPNLDASEIIYINAGGSIISVTRYTMYQIKGEMLLPPALIYIYSRYIDRKSVVA